MNKNKKEIIFLTKSLKNNFNYKKKVNGKFKKNINIIKRKYLNTNNYFVVIRNFEKNQSNTKIKLLNFLKYFGKIIHQDNKGSKIINISPDLRRLKKNTYRENKQFLRYHETNFGGSMHSDGPQLFDPPKYVAMMCVQKSSYGWITILVNTKKVFSHLRKYHPKKTSILKKNFCFERRGFYTKRFKVIRKPIFKKYKKFNFYSFRYLREYLVNCHTLAKMPLSKDQFASIKLLDTYLNNKKFQKRLTLNSGDLIILNNYFIAHGRSKFKIQKKSNRSLLRIWVS